jgi:RHS repeat-associated protein
MEEHPMGQRLDPFSMISKARSLLFPVLIVSVLFAHAPVEAAAPADPSADGPDWASLSIGFEELFVPTTATSRKEDAALERAILSYRERAKVDDFRALENFLAGYPHSGWRVALLTNLGLSYYRYGYFSKAIDAFERAWREGREATEPKAKALVDRAVGELLKMHARLGHSEQLAALLNDVGRRGLTGPATELSTGAREGLWTMHNNPGIAYLCGPMALKNLLVALGVPLERLAFLDDYRSGPHGVTLAQVGQLAAEAKIPYRIVHRRRGQPIPVPSVIHWKVDHVATIVAEKQGRYEIEDPTFGLGRLSVTREAIDAEGTGFFLVPGEQPDLPWRIATADETNRIKGMGYTTSNLGSATTPQDDKTKGDHCGGGMCDYNFTEMLVSLNLNDRPVGYAPPIGPPVYARVTYNHREMSQPANPNFFNVGPKWTLNWLSYIQEYPSAICNGLSRYVAGGGSICYSFDDKTSSFVREARDASLLVMTATNPVVYQRQLADGGVEVYGQSDSAAPGSRRIFLSQIVDPAGNALTFSYDNRLRLTSITDATNRVTTLSYGQSGQPLLVTKITDPFGRYAQLNYDSMGRLFLITDVLGLTSKFMYDAANPSFIDSMTTAYGATQFYAPSDAQDQHPPYGTPNSWRTLCATDPRGYTEALQFSINSLINVTEMQIPTTGLYSPQTPLNNAFLQTRNTLYWDQHALQAQDPAQNICSDKGDFLIHWNAPGPNPRIKHWHHLGFTGINTFTTADTIESIKYPLESRIWFEYPGQRDVSRQGLPGGGTVLASAISPTLDKPTFIGRVLDGGSSQTTQLAYNDLGHITSIGDPVGRQTTFFYDPKNQIDLMAIYQGSDPIASFGPYNSQHRPASYTDAAGQMTKYAYNPAGQLTQITDPLGEPTTFNYDLLGYLLSIVNANGKIQTSFTYDCCGRIATRTDSEGYTVTYGYDNMDRLTSETYPDGTSRTYTWDEPGRPLDLHTITDRLTRRTTYQHDAVRNLVAVTDPLGNTTKFDYWENGKLKSMTDPNGFTTRWDIDDEGRVIAKHYVDNSTITYTYEPSTSRLQSVTDALGQTKLYSYYHDDRISNINYQNAKFNTLSSSFVYDDFYPRLTNVVINGANTDYFYVNVGALGANQLLSENHWSEGHGISYVYDELGRLKGRTVDGDTETFSYDAIGRLATHQDDLGQFAISYLGQTPQVMGLHRLGPPGAVRTDWSYDTNLNDRRLKSITNSGTARSYTYTTQPEEGVTGIIETVQGLATRNWSYDYDDDNRLLSATFGPALNPRLSPIFQSTYGYHYDSADNLDSISLRGLFGVQNTVFTFDGLNELTSGNAHYDLNGNLVEDNLHTYDWDAENRLVAIFYKNSPGAFTSFKYDGFGRRISISESTFSTSPSQISTTTLQYVWCGEVLCEEAQPPTTSPALTARRYFTEGEVRPQFPLTRRFYYGTDHLGSIRNVMDATTGQNLQAYDYDPYGRDITTQLEYPAYSTDFRYAGMFYHQPSGLYLTHYRAYDPRYGRWLSRDPYGEFIVDLADEGRFEVNLYPYVLDNPLKYTDPTGECPWCIAAIIGGLGSAAIDLASQLMRNGGNWQCVDVAEVGIAAAEGALLSGLGPEGFLLGRGGAKAVQYGYSETAGVLNSGTVRFGWGYRASTNSNVLRVGAGLTHYDLPFVETAPLANPFRSGAIGAVGAGALNGSGCGCSAGGP